MLAVKQTWPAKLVSQYQQKGYWRGETFDQWIQQRCNNSAQNIAVVDQAGSWSYQQLEQQINNTAHTLQQLGFKQGDRIVVQLPNIKEFISCIFAMFKLGVIPIYALPAHRFIEIKHFIETGFACGYLISSQNTDFDYCQLAQELASNCPQLSKVLVLGASEQFINLEQLIQQVSKPKINLPKIHSQDVAFMQISGGSTGLPKLIPRTHDDYIYSFRQSAQICGLTEHSNLLVVLPMAHNFPMSSPGFMGALYVGAKIVLSPSPSPEIAFALIEQQQISSVSLVPPLLMLWLQAVEHNKFDLSSLKVIQVGGAKLLTEVAKRVQPILGAKLQQVFGMAEGLVNYTRLDDSEQQIINTQGYPMCPDDEILIVDDQDEAVAPGQSGHLLVRGPYTIRNYYNNSTANARSFTAEGYYRTGDIVQMNQDGYLIVQGRADDQINRAGEKISAEEIEEHLVAHPSVYDAVVVSVPDTYLGERSCAFIITQGQQPKKNQLKQWFRQRGLAEFKIPDQIIFIDSFNTTAVGKISRKDLRQNLKQLHFND